MRVTIAIIALAAVGLAGYLVLGSYPSINIALTEDVSIPELVKSAKQGDAEAQYNLGVMYSTGQGVPQDDHLAVMWYRAAAEQGYLAARGRSTIRRFRDCHPF